ncbi:hypothetical protein GCM10007907_23650 [Chitinimonas prasina]|uniref:Transposase n=1 Tax=Chitinimonas prasina TaxID=1434937 RepID=A0ABQ5YF19_9NEIS|nr:hypothetical protein GCM10007907_23650 [Chitinimonas prasina]
MNNGQPNRCRIVLQAQPRCVQAWLGRRSDQYSYLLRLRGGETGNNGQAAVRLCMSRNSFYISNLLHGVIAGRVAISKLTWVLAV